ncbi:MAG: hypothetical protein OXN84_17315 [Albidovulum sp.]|nr:hypothetical protein [Albidovulum sp.]
MVSKRGDPLPARCIPAPSYRTGERGAQKRFGCYRTTGLTFIAFDQMTFPTIIRTDEKFQLNSALV